jgi:maleate isomerase
MQRNFALATITPSGNRVVENVSQAICRDLPDVSLHFTRIPVHGDTTAAADYDWERMSDAAILLSHAMPDCICWNGTKGGALGFDVDRELCSRLGAATGLPVVTSALGILDLLRAAGAERIALVTPYDAAYQAKCIAGFAAQGITCVSERHSDLIDNLSYASVGENDIAAMTRAAVAEASPQAVVFFCTNFNGARVGAALEREIGLPVLDSTAVGVWASLKAGGYDTGRIRGWGNLFGC